MNQHTTNDEGPGRQSKPFDKHTANDGFDSIAPAADNASATPPIPPRPPIPPLPPSVFPDPEDPIERAIWDATLLFNVADWAVGQAWAAVDTTGREAKEAADRAEGAHRTALDAENAWDRADDALKAAIKAKYTKIAVGFKRGDAA